MVRNELSVMSNMPTVMTRQCREVELENAGVTGVALECLLRETAPERHASRVAYARWAAEEYYLDQVRIERDEMSPEGLAVAAQAVLLADMIGVGGRDGVEGLATTRHPAFASCGKGRKQAMDGPAWDAAIRDAAWYGPLSRSMVFTVNENGVLVLMGRTAPCLRTAEPDYAEVAVDETIAPVAWRISILREGLRRAAGLERWHPGVYFDAPPESVGRWADLLNDLVREVPTAGSSAEVVE